MDRSDLLERAAGTLRRKSVRGDNGCLLWTGFRKKDGYGVIGLNMKLVSVHRVAWLVANGPIPNGMCVLHRCDVRNCIEPSHLWLGTYADNNRDCFTKGRHISIGGWNQGHPLSLETKAKIAAAARARPHRRHTQEARAKMSQARSDWWKRHREEVT